MPILALRLSATEAPADFVSRTAATFARASTATLVAADGTIQSVAADVLRRSYVADATGGLVPTYLIQRANGVSGEDLLPDPLLLTEDVSAWPGATFSPELPPGSPSHGSIRLPDVAAGAGVEVRAGYLPIDITQPMRMLAQVRPSESDGTKYGDQHIYVGFASYDADGLLISPWMYAHVAGSALTTLAAPLNPGDTTLTLADPTGWYDGAAGDQRNLLWWPYSTASGDAQAPYTYSRNMGYEHITGASLADGCWAAGGISGAVVTLMGAWTGPALPAGTPVMNTQKGDSYTYLLANFALFAASVWTALDGSPARVYDATVDSGVPSNLWRPGTRSIAPVALDGFSATSYPVTLYLADLHIYRRPVATTAADTLTVPLPAALVGQSVARYQRYYDLATQQWVEAVDTITATATLTLDVDRAYRDVLIATQPGVTLQQFQDLLATPLTGQAPAWRLRVYAPRSVDPSETTVLTPIAGASHSEPLQVATCQGVTGYAPYLLIPQGRKTTLDLLERKLQGGQYTFQIGDKRLTTDNATRWATTFLGDGQGIAQLKGLRWELDRTEDHTAAPPVWTREATGRINDVKLDGYLVLTLACVTMADDLTGSVFVGRPHSSVTYAVEPQLWPLGLSGAYGNFPVAATMTGTIQTSSAGGGQSVVLDAASLANAANLVSTLLTAQPFKIGAPTRITAAKLRPDDANAIARVVVSGTAQDYNIAAIGTFLRVTIPTIESQGVREIYLARRTGGASLPANGTAVSVSIRTPQQAPTADAPLMLGDVHPAQLLADILDGKFGYLGADGAIRRAYARDTASWAALIADPSFPAVRCVIDKTWKIEEFLPALCRQTGLAYRENEQGEIVGLDVRLPQTLPTLPELTDADLASGDAPEWSDLRKSAITQMDVQWYVDQRVDAGDVTFDQARIATPPSSTLTKALARHLLDVDFGRIDLGDKPVQIDAFALRACEDEITQGMDRELWVRGQILSMIEDFRAPFAYGPQQISALFQRSATVRPLREGDLVTLTLGAVPNPGTNTRGGSRLARIIEWDDAVGGRRITAIDLGPSVALATPTIGSLALLSGNTEHGITFSLTLDAAHDPAIVQVAVTETDVSVVGEVPANRWTRTYRLTAAQTVTVQGLPSGKRIWVRARSEMGSTSIAKLPSGWVYATGPDFIDTTTLTAPSNLTVVVVSALRAQFTWTNGSTTTNTRIWLASPSGADQTSIDVVPAGATGYEITGTTPGATYTVQVQHDDGAGGTSALSNAVDWTASGTAETCPVPRALVIYEDPTIR